MMICSSGGLIISVTSFFTNRRTTLKVADEKRLADIREDFDRNKKAQQEVNAKLIAMGTKMDTHVQVLEERINNEIKQTGKSLDQLNDKLDDILRGDR